MDKLKMRANSRRLLVKYCRRHSVWYDAGIEMLLLLLLLFGESGNIEAQGAASVAWPESATDMNQGGPSTFRRRLAEQTDASHSYKALAGGDSEGFRVPARIERLHGERKSSDGLIVKSETMISVDCQPSPPRNESPDRRTGEDKKRLWMK
ncbi:hypothetical protein GE21DRAFT_3460 [Neurospora crassa]|uniref:Uncharacterized protein n=1 Tax=Neurospora crassa (strain ATCC 24698 / 74-OR23-1A / CBS 708.71 / DSM 1257 / FGSC 987) TaxID=367110 RepID=Q1K5J5_NEUCR|nr:hypothetical protein NCU01526 [Neurospora crassa OR74A]EAA27739.2 hypothetical protein NCU01526 [Neurospora crassa OR74A]KHE87216.1 hypothetical protein GE21DRAFT_3460 [Neurospora crassa]|eukprot:XP_956975.2 hypothetical protein NCU01526 [Neurospora crassa OR74A]